MSQFSTADEIIEIIEKRKNRGYGLEHFRTYMSSIGNPQDQLRTIHVAGTNGKGSTTNDLRSILQEAGYQVGTFTSPYMVTHRDRMRINDIYIDEQAFIELTSRYFDDWMKWDLSMFEIDMCMACIWFLEQHVDYAIFEVGLGGRKDFTNIITPMVSVITNIGMDHMELLGDTYEKIAREKAGIIKPHVDVITAEEKAGCLAVFQTCAKAQQSICLSIQEVNNIHMNTHITFDYREMKDIALASDARYQCRNAALAIETILYLHKKRFIHCSENHIRVGLRKATWIGRFEVISHDPLIVLDGAHNVDGIQALCYSLQDIKNPVFVFSVLKDKNFEEMITCLQTVSDSIFVCQLHNDRALDIHELRERTGLSIIDEVEVALSYAKQQLRPIIITGSLYFISEVRDNLINNKYKMIQSYVD